MKEARVDPAAIAGVWDGTLQLGSRPAQNIRISLKASPDGAIEGKVLSLAGEADGSNAEIAGRIDAGIMTMTIGGYAVNATLTIRQIIGRICGAKCGSIRLRQE